MRRVAANHAAAFELPQPLEHGRGRQPHNPGDFSLRDPGVVLEEVEYLEIDGVEHLANLPDREASNSLPRSQSLALSKLIF